MNCFYFYFNSKRIKWGRIYTSHIYIYTHTKYHTTKDINEIGDRGKKIS